MTVSVVEERGRLYGAEDSRRIRRYRCTYNPTTDEEADIVTAVRATAPATWNGMPRVDELLEEKRTRPGVTLDYYWVDVIYENPDRGSGARNVSGQRPNTGDEIFRFETGGLVETVYAGISLRDSAGPDGGGAEPDIGTPPALNPDPQTGPRGAGLIVPQLKFTVEQYKAHADMTSTYIGHIVDLTGKTNNATWQVTVYDGSTKQNYSFEAEEVLFEGCAGEYRTTENDWRLFMRFSAKPNVTIAAGSTYSEDLTKKGHDYIQWIYKRTVDANDNATVEMRGAYVVKVYETGDFSNLAIGP